METNFVCTNIDVRPRGLPRPTNQNLKDKLVLVGVLWLRTKKHIAPTIVGTGVLDGPNERRFFANNMAIYDNLGKDILFL